MTRQDLAEICRLKGLWQPNLSPPNKNCWRVADFEKLLAQEEIRKLVNVPWGLAKRESIESPQLCFSGWEKLRPKEQEEITLSGSWVAEEKFSGTRVLICGHYSEGISVWGRFRGPNFLYREYTDHVVYVNPSGEVESLRDCRPPKDFVLDAELVFRTPVTGITTDVFLDNGVEFCRSAQLEGRLMTFKIFDIVYIGGGCVFSGSNYSFATRRRTLLDFLHALSDFHLPIRLGDVPEICSDLEGYYEEVVARNGEGVILKNTDQVYVPKVSRSRTGWIKRRNPIALHHGSY